jgi:hypothetical protein
MIGLTRGTAERIKRIIDRSPGNVQDVSKGRWRGHRPFLVKCTSSTAADTSGVGAQCYPGVIVELDPAATTHDTLGTVWLTLIGDDAEPIQPVSGVVYSCLMAGKVEAATDDTRPRAFAASGTTSDSANCSSWLSLPECATLTIVAADGSCGCIDLTQTASMTRESGALVSDDRLYGCPPGIVTEDCPDDGGPSKFNLVVAGFTGASVGYNGNWTLTYTTTPSARWTQTRDGVTWYVSGSAGSNWNLYGDDGSSSPTYEDVSVASCCEEITLTLDDGGSSTDPPATLTITPATACGNGPAYTPRIDIIYGDCGQCFRMRWVPVAGSGARTITFREVGCGSSNGSPYIEFASADELLCKDDATECGDNRLLVRVTCDQCSVCDCETGIAWDGAGYYCVDNVGCLLLSEDPGETYKLCMGPFDTQSECEDYVLVNCTSCDGGSALVPKSMCVSIALDTGTDCICVDGLEFVITWVDGVWINTAWLGNDIAPDNSLYDTGCEVTGFEPNTWLFNLTGAYIHTDPCVIKFEAIIGRTLTGGGTANVGSLTGQSGSDGMCDLADGTPVTFTASTSGVSGFCGDNPTYTVTITPSTDNCEPSPVQPTYNCVNGTCIEVFDGSGKSLAECEDECGIAGDCSQDDCCIEGGDGAVLNIPDGTYAGNYFSVWNANVSSWLAYFTVPGLGTVSVYIYTTTSGCSYEIGVDTDEGTTTCNPLLATFAGTDFGATGDVTVS